MYLCKIFMKAFIRILGLLLVLMVTETSSLMARNDRDTLNVGKRMNFSENQGQWDSRVRYRSQMHGAALFLEDDRFTILVEHPHNGNLHHHPSAEEDRNRYRSHSYQVVFVGGKSSGLEGGDAEEFYENYFIGNDPQRWKGGVPVFTNVTYRDLYPGIDLKVYSAETALKYDFIVAPNANPNAIRLHYEGDVSTRLQDGNIIIHTSVADIVELRPYAYQIINGEEQEVDVHYHLKNNEVEFVLGEYDASVELVIDPYLYFSTYTGSTADNWGTTAAYDMYKNTYTAGLVFMNGYPTSIGAYDGTYNGNSDVGIFVFNPDGSQRIYSTYLGGGLGDMPHSLFVNDLNELVVFGTTGSHDFPTSQNAYCRTFNGGTNLQYESVYINYPNGSDIFVSRFSSDGTELAASTYIGGSSNDGLNYENYYNDPTTMMLGNDSLYFNYGDGARGELITDDLANVYVGTTTQSSDFPMTPLSFNHIYSGNQDGVVFKLDYNLSHLLWSGYLGGMKDDAIYSIDVDNHYNLVVTGGTNSPDFRTTPGTLHTSYIGGSADGFVAKISYHGDQLLASTLYGSTRYDQSYFVRVGKKNEVFIFGQTKAQGSTLVYNANYNTPNSGQFVARLTPNLDTIVWSTVFGTGNGEPNISPTAFATDICNRVYCVGWGRKFGGYNLGGQRIPWNTHGTWGMPITPDAYQTQTDGQDFYIFSMDMNASQQTYGSFFGEVHTNTAGGGNDHVDGGTSRFDRCATLYQSVCASCGHTNNFPTTPNAWSADNNSNNCNNAVFRINVADDFPVADFCQPPTTCAPALDHQFVFTGRADSVRWYYGDGSSDTGHGTQHNGQHTYMSPGIYTVRLIAYMANGCKTSDTVEHEFQVVGGRSYWLDTVTTCPGSGAQIGTHPLLNATYQWILGTVSDSNVANPFVYQSGTYCMLVSSNNGPHTCVDTVWQVAELGSTDFIIEGDTNGCHSPLTFSAHNDTSSLLYVWSHYADLRDTINTDPHSSNVSLDVSESTWLYLHATDNLGCAKLDSIHIRFYSIIDSVATIPTSCPETCDGEARFYPSSMAESPYSFTLDNQTSGDSIAHDLCGGFHSLVMRDAKGCEVYKPFVIPTPPVPEITHQVNHIGCHADELGAITITISGPNPYSIIWEDDSSTLFHREGLAAGVYIAVLIDTAGCTIHDTIEVLNHPEVNVEAMLQKNSCQNYCDGIATAHATGGNAPYTFEWNDGETGATATELCEGWHMVVVTDQHGCKNFDTIYIPQQHSFDDIHSWADDTVLYSYEWTNLHTTSIPNGQYEWHPAHLLNNPNQATTSTVPMIDTTEFVVTLTDSLGCSYNDTLIIYCIKVDCGRSNVFIPNLFTPNSDGLNDQFCFQGEYIKEFHIVIFTRWGELVYESHDINECWDGRYKNNWCQPGVYTYYCTVVCEGNQEGKFKGDVTLIR